MSGELKKAVALKYNDGAVAPIITANAKGFLAEKILKIAAENEIPVTEDKNLVDFLSVQEVGQAIPEETWEAVAKIFAFVVDWSKKNA